MIAKPIGMLAAALALPTLLGACAEEEPEPAGNTEFEEAQPAPVPTDLPGNEPVPDNTDTGYPEVGGGVNAGGGMAPEEPEENQAPQ